MPHKNSNFNGDERTKLLQEISALESNGSEGPLPIGALRDLKLQHNALVGTNSRAIRYMDSSQYLPPELWTHILLKVIDDDCLDILPFIQVCQRWASIILSSSRLWTFIYIRGDLDALEGAHSALFLSKGLPLCMTIDVPIASVVQERFLQREASRIQHLKIKVLREYFPLQSGSSDDLLGYCLGNLFKDLGLLPSLESLTIDESDIRDSTLFLALRHLNAPHIKYIAPAQLSDDALAHPRYAGLQSLETSSPLGSVISKLIRLADLKDLVLLGSIRERQEMPPESYTKLCQRVAPLEYLRSYQRSWSYISPLLSSVSSSIRMLELSIVVGQAFDFFSIIHGAPCLQKLRLAITADSTLDDVRTIHWKARPLPYIRDLLMNVRSRVPAALYIAEITRALLNALHYSLFKVQIFHLISDIFGIDLVRFIDNLEDLNILYLDGSEGQGQGYPVLPTHAEPQQPHTSGEGRLGI
ncbi:4988_t:CDS:2 [Acaulospora colombiana]|uniref:4988_t:CDS:1 n=1 Tax=Acaulospora colombiana TaxID=27376 RepID=A0ACA9KQP6_9GLOM|nr:4988_t:CDS:2 [Acaulospora colombiana]